MDNTVFYQNLRKKISALAFLLAEANDCFGYIENYNRYSFTIHEGFKNTALGAMEKICLLDIAIILDKDEYSNTLGSMRKILRNNIHLFTDEEILNNINDNMIKYGISTITFDSIIKVLEYYNKKQETNYKGLNYCLDECDLLLDDSLEENRIIKIIKEHRDKRIAHLDYDFVLNSNTFFESHSLNIKEFKTLVLRISNLLNNVLLLIGDSSVRSHSISYDLEDKKG